MRSSTKRNLLAWALSVPGFTTIGTLNVARAEEKDNKPSLQGRIVAVGIPGASAISPVGTFLPGGPIHDKPALHAFTAPGQVLDPVRILVGSSSNFGEPLARTDQREGYFLSIDPNGVTLARDPRFASAGSPRATLGGRAQAHT